MFNLHTHVEWNPEQCISSHGCNSWGSLFIRDSQQARGWLELSQYLFFVYLYWDWMQLVDQKRQEGCLNRERRIHRVL